MNKLEIFTLKPNFGIIKRCNYAKMRVLFTDKDRKKKLEELYYFLKLENLELAEKFKFQIKNAENIFLEKLGRENPSLIQKLKSFLKDKL